MTKMIVLTYDDGEKSAVASWSEEYGWFMAGDAGIIANLTIEERESRIVPPKATGSIFPPGPPSIGVLTNTAEPEMGLLGGGPCFSCECPESAHVEGGCAKHGCRTYVP